MRTMSHPVAKKRSFWVRDMERLGFGSAVVCAEADCGSGICAGVWSAGMSKVGTIAEGLGRS
jgi:hypothetical protein